MYSTPLISIIVPVYNVEKYLEECIESIITQSYKNIEVILVNDGSTDNSQKICDEYAKQDNRIKVIHQQNAGVSVARNNGIDLAIGEYILFVDADDFIGEESLFQISEQINFNKDIDIMFLEAFKFFEKEKKAISLGDGYIANKILNKSKKEVFKHLADLPKYPGSSWAKLFASKFIKKNSLYFPNGVHIGEDLEFVLKALLCAKEFSYCDVNYYYYRQQREGSATNVFKLKNFVDLLNFIKKYVDINKNSSLYEYKEEIYSFMAYEYAILLSMYSKLNSKEKEIYSKEINLYSYLLQYRRDKKNVIIKICYKLLGLNITSKLLNIYLEIR